MKDKILKLREEGKSYRAICQELNCSKATVNYYCSLTGKNKVLERTRKLRIDNPLIEKVSVFKNRLKVKSEEFQHRHNNAEISSTLLPYNSELMNFTWQDIVRLIEETPFCYLTGDKLDLNNLGGISLDHKIPVSRGGDNSIKNLGLCSVLTNRSKTDMTHDEYIQHCLKVVKHHGYIVQAPPEGDAPS